MKAGVLCSPACGCEGDSDPCADIVSLEDLDGENMSDDSSDSDYD